MAAIYKKLFYNGKKSESLVFSLESYIKSHNSKWQEKLILAMWLVSEKIWGEKVGFTVHANKFDKCKMGLTHRVSRPIVVRIIIVWIRSQYIDTSLYMYWQTLYVQWFYYKNYPK
jgi:hypothetical protein